MTGQTLIIMLGALVLMLSTIRLVRLRLLSIRYGIGWLVVAAVGLVGSPILTFVTRRLDLFGFTPTGFSLGIFILFLGLVCLQLSVSLSGLHRAIQDIAEHSAHVEARIRAIEGDAAPRSTPGAAGRLETLADRVAAASEAADVPSPSPAPAQAGRTR